MTKHKITKFNDENAKKLAKIVSANPRHDTPGFISAITHLAEFQSTGKVVPSKQYRKKRCYTFKGPVGSIILKFLEHCRNELQLSTSRLNGLENYLYPFNQFCIENGVKEYKLIAVLSFLKNYKFKFPNQAQYCISALVILTKCLHKLNIIEGNFSDRIPRFRRITQPKMPSVYSPKEIQKIIATIDPSTSIGKRDLAIALLATELGLRASDIIELQFDHIDWEKKIIDFKQVKTGGGNKLPLVTGVHDALVDYIRVRRKSTEPFIFLMEMPPFGKITHQVVSHVFDKAIQRAGVEVGTRTIGARAFRSSLASSLLSRKEGINIISRILGHKSRDMAKHYIRIDMNSLSLCAQEVPPIDDNFYTNNGFIL